LELSVGVAGKKKLVARFDNEQRLPQGISNRSPKTSALAREAAGREGTIKILKEGSKMGERIRKI